VSCQVVLLKFFDTLSGEYKLTSLGLSLSAAFCGVWSWAAENLDHVEQARRTFDGKARAD
jgi:DNA-binding HxlR family transcriptional regulator